MKKLFSILLFGTLSAQVSYAKPLLMYCKGLDNNKEAALSFNYEAENQQEATVDILLKYLYSDYGDDKVKNVKVALDETYSPRAGRLKGFKRFKVQTETYEYQLLLPPLESLRNQEDFDDVAKVSKPAEARIESGGDRAGEFTKLECTLRRKLR